MLVFQLSNHQTLIAGLPAQLGFLKARLWLWLWCAWLPHGFADSHVLAVGWHGSGLGLDLGFGLGLGPGLTLGLGFDLGRWPWLCWLALALAASLAAAKPMGFEASGLGFEV